MNLWIINRLKEPSTYAGLAGLAGAFGIAEPVYQAATSFIMALAGLAAIFLAEKQSA